jgi:hypothetical protein
MDKPMTKEEEEVKNPRDKEGPGAGLMGRGGIVIVTAYLVLMLGVIIYLLVVLWPPNRANEVRDQLLDDAAKGSPSPAASPSATESPAPEASPVASVAPASLQLASIALLPQAPPRQSPTVTPATPTVTPTPPAPSPTPTGSPATNATQTTVTEPDCEKAARIREGFCLDEQMRPRAGVGALKFLGRCYCVWDEDRLLLIVLLCGALGSLIHGLRSFSWYVGNREAVWSWSAWYFMLPFFGSALSFVFYLVIRGGFFSPNSTVTQAASPFGFAAMSALIGMFSEAAINKLRRVAFTIFEPPEKGKDHVGPAPRITGISPAQGSTEGREKVTLTGENFAGAVKVTFGGADAKVLSSTATSVVLETPAHDKGKVDVVVKNGDGQEHPTKEAFEYVEPPPPPPPPDNSGGGNPGGAIG